MSLFGNTINNKAYRLQTIGLPENFISGTSEYQEYSNGRHSIPNSCLIVNYSKLMLSLPKYSGYSEVQVSRNCTSNGKELCTTV
jgi:hypothetical protein